MPNQDIALMNQNSPGWLFFVKACFGLSIVSMVAGIFFAPVDLWVKGYMAMGALFTVGSTFTLAKTMRDEFEAAKIANRITDAKTERMLKEFE